MLTASGRRASDLGLGPHHRYSMWASWRRSFRCFLDKDLEFLLAQIVLGRLALLSSALTVLRPHTAHSSTPPSPMVGGSISLSPRIQQEAARRLGDARRLALAEVVEPRAADPAGKRRHGARSPRIRARSRSASLRRWAICFWSAFGRKR